MKIYELTAMNRQLLELLEKEEITQEDFEENKQMLVELLEEKSESLIFVNMELETEINRLKEVEKMLAEKRKLLENKQEKFKEFVLNTLDSLNLEEIKTAIGKIKITKSTSTIVEESKLGTDCFDYIQKRKTIKEIESLGYKLEKQTNRKVSFK